MSIKHGHTWKGGRTPTYGSWQSMHRRCRPDGHYGVLGITVCERWRTFENFLADMGERPVGTTIDRIDNNCGYEPGNCRWADQPTQYANRRWLRRSRFTQEQVDWVRSCGLTQVEIAGILGVTQAHISKIMRNGLLNTAASGV